MAGFFVLVKFDSIRIAARYLLFLLRHDLWHRKNQIKRRAAQFLNWAAQEKASWQ